MQGTRSAARCQCLAEQQYLVSRFIDSESHCDNVTTVVWTIRSWIIYRKSRLVLGFLTTLSVVGIIFDIVIMMSAGYSRTS